MRLQLADFQRQPPAAILARLRAALSDPTDAIALVLPTSGSTGAPKQVLLPSAALFAAATASHARLSGPGRWLAALPLTHIGGLQILVRAICSDTDPIITDVTAGFHVPAFLADLADLTRGPGPRYTSLVPTQLARVLDAAPHALAALDAVLIGGASAPPALLERARAAGINAIDSYGMTETCGGVIYDGKPLDGVLVGINNNRIRIGGPTVAVGYHESADGFHQTAGARWFYTNDIGRWDGHTLRVIGRADDVIISGGINVVPAQVEALIAALPGVRECLVVGVPDPYWGQRVEALIVGGPLALAEVRAGVAQHLGKASAPKAVHQVDAIPTRGPGKPDRQAALALVTGPSPIRPGP